MNRFNKWLSSILHDELQSALVLIVVAVATLILSLSPFAQTLVDFTHLKLPFDMSLRHFAGEWLISIFFLIAGIELRYELSVGSLASFRTAIVPIMSAVFGMTIPATIYLALSTEPQAWGVVMPTDLPFALAVLAIFARSASTEIRAFVISLAIVDDALSVVALSATTGQLQIHPSLIAILIGLSLPIDFGDKVRHLLHPVSTGIVLPLFAITALAFTVQIADFFNSQSLPIVISRVIGKPLGILIGALVAVAVLRARPSITWRQIAVIGCVCSVGFSVSLLFAANSNLADAALLQTTAAIVLAIPLTMACGALASLFLRHK